MTPLRRFGRLLLGLLRELADENAYRRYLIARGQPHSGAEWRNFSEQRMRTKFVTPRCC